MSTNEQDAAPNPSQGEAPTSTPATPNAEANPQPSEEKAPAPKGGGKKMKKGAADKSNKKDNAKQKEPTPLQKATGGPEKTWASVMMGMAADLQASTPDIGMELAKAGVNKLKSMWKGKGKQGDEQREDEQQEAPKKDTADANTDANTDADAATATNPDTAPTATMTSGADTARLNDPQMAMARGVGQEFDETASSASGLDQDPEQAVTEEDVQSPGLGR